MIAVVERKLSNMLVKLYESQPCFK